MVLKLQHEPPEGLTNSGGTGPTPRVDQGCSPRLYISEFLVDAAGLGPLVENLWPALRDATGFMELASVTWSSKELQPNGEDIRAINSDLGRQERLPENEPSNKLSPTGEHQPMPANPRGVGRAGRTWWRIIWEMRGLPPFPQWGTLLAPSQMEGQPKVAV